MASLYSCVSASDLATVKKAADSYKKMGDLNTVKAAARSAGSQLQDRMRKMVEGEASLRSYADVGESITIFEDGRNMVVGIPPNTPTALRAANMHSIYQLTDVAQDLASQSGDIEQHFLDELAGSVST